MFSVYRFNYDLADGKQTWTAYIAGDSIEEAQAHLEKKVSGPNTGYRLNTAGRECDLHDITDSLIKVVMRKNVIKEDPSYKVKLEEAQKEIAMLRGVIEKIDAVDNNIVEPEKKTRNRSILKNKVK